MYIRIVPGNKSLLSLMSREQEAVLDLCVACYGDTKEDYRVTIAYELQRMPPVVYWELHNEKSGFDVIINHQQTMPVKRDIKPPLRILP